MSKKVFTLIALAIVFVLAFATFAPLAASPNQVQACGNIHTTNLGNWDLSETRAQGHNELQADGLHIWTESNTSLDKAAGYYPFAVLLSNITSGNIDYVASFGITPGLQLVVDFDNNGTPDGILVGEAVYGDNWWLSNSAAAFVKSGAPHTGGGNGSNWFGTLPEWAVAFPNAQVIAVGYSLGSGVHGDGVIESMTFGCYVFTFGLPQPGEPEEPVVPFSLGMTPSGGFVCMLDVVEPINPPMYPQVLEGSEWAPWDGWVSQTFKGDDQHSVYEIALFANPSEYPYQGTYRVVGNQLNELRFFEVVQPGVCAEVSDPLAQ